MKVNLLKRTLLAIVLNPVNKLLLHGDFSLLLTLFTLDRYSATIPEKQVQRS